MIRNNKHTISNFSLQRIYERDPFDPKSIKNCHEKGVRTARKPEKIIPEKGQKQVSKKTQAERGQPVTVCCAVNSTRNYIPAFVDFEVKTI